MLRLYYGINHPNMIQEAPSLRRCQGPSYPNIHNAFVTCTSLLLMVCNYHKMSVQYREVPFTLI
jgi:hypothetical protein